jgi:hypothetical protein
MMMEAARTSETSVDIDLTKCQYIAEDSELQKLYTFSLFLNYRYILHIKQRMEHLVDPEIISGQAQTNEETKYPINCL